MKTLFVLVGSVLILTFAGHWLKDQISSGNWWALVGWIGGVCILAWIVMHDHERQEIKDALRGLLSRSPGDEDRS